MTKISMNLVKNLHQLFQGAVSVEIAIEGREIQ